MTVTVNADFVALQRALAGEYSLERELGRGGMGIVYLAREVQLDRLVAIKVLPSALAARQDLRERFIREARTAAGLSHPHIVPIHRVGEAGGFVFFVMAYIEGVTLGERLRTRGPLTPEATGRLLREVAWALAYAHQHGVVHRDIKPDNILLERETGRALVSDFGIAQAASGAVITDPEQVIGTAQFMSPEQALNERLDGRSDLYSLGVLGYVALTGRLPFEAATVPALLAQHIHARAPSVASVASSAPEPLVRVIDRCLQKDPGDRFASGEALADALEPTAVARPELPTALRVLVRQENPLRPVYIAWSGVFTIGTIVTLQTALRHARFLRNGWWEVLIVAGFAVAPALPAIGFHLRQAYRVFRAGYSLADLRLALRRWRQERREELAYEMDAEPTFGMRALRAVAIGSSALFVGTGLLLNNTAFFNSGLVRMGVLLAPFVSLAACNALGVPIVSRESKLRSIGALRTRFWNSRLGEWTAKMLGAGRRGAVPAEMVHRPTESALSLAAAELYAALPSAYREQLRELPDVIRSLEARAARLREVTAEVARLASLGGHADELKAKRDRATQDLTQTVAALEGIRLDLLRLHGGAIEVGSLTTVMESAQRIGRELNILAEARREADDAARTWRPLDAPATTPV